MKLLQFRLLGNSNGVNEDGDQSSGGQSPFAIRPSKYQATADLSRNVFGMTANEIRYALVIQYMAH